MVTSANVTVTALQASLVVGAVNDGVAGQFIVALLAGVIVGGVTSTVHVAVRDVLDVLLQASTAVNVLV